MHPSVLSRSMLIGAITLIPRIVSAHDGLDGIANLDNEPTLPAYAERLTDFAFQSRAGGQPQGDGGVTLVEEGPDGEPVRLQLNPVSGEINP